MIADAHRPAIATANLRLPGTFLVDGFVAGLWVATRKKGAAALELRPLAAIGKAARTALEAEGESLLRFIEPDAVTFTVTHASRL
jgi:hypothetical protein